jgi:hypothetical protein
MKEGRKGGSETRVGGKGRRREKEGRSERKEDLGRDPGTQYVVQAMRGRVAMAMSLSQVG